MRQRTLTRTALIALALVLLASAAAAEEAPPSPAPQPAAAPEAGTTVSAAASAQAELERGRQLYMEASFPEAAAAFQAVVEREGVDDATAMEAYRHLAALELVFGHQDVARQHARAALEIDRTTTPPEGAPAEADALFEEVRAAMPAVETAPEPEPEPEPERPGFGSRWVTLGLGVGVYVPTIVNDMLPHVTVGIDAGVLLPFHDRRLSIVLGCAYSPPGVSGEDEDPRIGQDGGSWSHEMQTHEIFMSLGLVYRILPPGVGRIWPYIGLVARLYMLRTNVSGEAEGAEFGENTEQSTQFGGALSAGAEVRLGPGAFWFELAFSISDLPHEITGPTNTGALAFNLGYRFFI